MEHRTIFGPHGHTFAAGNTLTDTIFEAGAYRSQVNHKIQPFWVKGGPAVPNGHTLVRFSIGHWLFLSLF